MSHAGQGKQPGAGGKCLGDREKEISLARDWDDELGRSQSHQSLGNPLFQLLTRYLPGSEREERLRVVVFCGVNIVAVQA